MVILSRIRAAPSALFGHLEFEAVSLIVL